MKKIIIIIFVLVFTVSCDNDFSDWNTDPKKATVVPASTLYSNAQRNLVRLMRDQDVNTNVFNFLAQYWTATTYPDEASYDFGSRDTPGGFWNIMYRDVLNDLKEANRVLLVEKEGLVADLVPAKDNEIAVVNILEVYAFHVLVDVFGDVPYTEALDIENSAPKYDDDAEIYAALFIKLDAAIAMMDTDEGSFGSADFIYDGKVSSWKKFANSLKLRMAMRVKNGTKVSEAIAGGVFTSNGDNAAFAFTSSDPYSNPLWENLVQSGRHDLLVADTFTDIMSSADPRASVFMESNVSPYEGAPYGANNTYSEFTQLGEAFHAPDLEGLIFDYAEVEFLLAEAAERGLGGVTGAESHYNSGISASIDYWTGGGSAAYLATVPYDAGNWENSIGTQKWLALYSRGFEGWSSWRVFGFPALAAPSSAHADAGGLVPVRYTYPEDEAERNGDNYEAASSAIGGDKLTTKIFWDN